MARFLRVFLLHKHALHFKLCFCNDAQMSLATIIHEIVRTLMNNIIKIGCLATNH